MKFSLITATAVSALLVGCGGTDGGGGATTPTTPTTTGISDLGSGQVLADLTATRVEFDATNNEMIIESIPFDDEVFEGRYTRDASFDRGAYRAYVSTRGFDQYIAYFDESASGAVSGAVAGGGNYLAHGYRGAMYQRNGDVTIPTTTQRAFYNGDYVGMRSNSETGGFQTVTGDARMEVDFSDNKVRGSIQNRAVVYNSRPSNPINTVRGTITFADGTLNRTNGSFTGGISTTDVDGSYEGVLADGTGDSTEMVGITRLTEDDFEENGTFIAVQ